MTRGEKVCAFIERHLRVPEGDNLGQTFTLLPFQRRFILEVYDNPKGTNSAYLSIARKNGKTSLIAAILLAHLVGPEAIQNSQIVSGAMSRDQASIVFALACKMVQASPTLVDLVHIVPSSKRLIGKPMNVEYKALAAEGKTAHGLSPVLAIIDEAGQIRGPTSDFIDAIVTSQAAYKQPLLIAISTQAATDADLFSEWLDKSEGDPHTVCHVYAADADCKIDDPEQWAKANPALGKFRDLGEMKRMADKADRMPSFENTFRNLNLNQRVESRSPFISRSVWQENNGEPSVLDGRKVWIGLDLSSVQDLTAMVAVACEGDMTDVEATHWLPGESVMERAKQDRVPYDVWKRDGKLKTCPGKAIRYEFVAHEIKAMFDRCDVQAVAFDRWNMSHLIPWLERAGLTPEQLEKFVEFGQGFRSISPAMNSLETMLLDGKMRHGGDPVLTMCAANAVAQQDPAGNRKLAKDRSSGRIDGMVALVMAVGVMVEQREDQGDIDGFLSDPIIVSY